jgi:hypothetical protein
MNPEQPTPPAEQQPGGATWMQKLSAILFCVFCLELGLFLLIYPWMGSLWNHNWLFSLRPEWQKFLLSEQFRGAVSGLGILNLFIGFLEIIRLRRFARR